MLSPNDPSFFEPVLSLNAPACLSAALTPVSISYLTAPPPPEAPLFDFEQLCSNYAGKAEGEKKNFINQYLTIRCNYFLFVLNPKMKSMFLGELQQEHSKHKYTYCTKAGRIIKQPLL